jgi:hypothetical protein
VIALQERGRDGSVAHGALAVDILHEPKGGEMPRDEKKLRITLEALRCTISKGDETFGTDALEIRGWQEAKGVTLDIQTGILKDGSKVMLWERPEDKGTISMGPGAELPINTSTTFPVFERDFLELGGVIVEEDTGPNDILGEGFMRIPYSDLPKVNESAIINVGFTKGEQEVLARYKVEVLKLVHHPELQ